MPTEEMGDRELLQPADINSRAVLMIVAGFMLFVAVSMAGLLAFLKTQAPDAFAPRTERQFPVPELQRLPETDLSRYQAAQRAALGSYAWIDRDHNIARIPIDQAMELIAESGERAYDALEAPPAPPPGASGVNP